MGETQLHIIDTWRVNLRGTEAAAFWQMIRNNLISNFSPGTMGKSALLTSLYMIQFSSNTQRFYASAQAIAIAPDYVLFSGCPSVPFSWTRHLRNTLRDFLQIQHKRTLGLKDELNLNYENIAIWKHAGTLTSWLEEFCLERISLQRLCSVLQQVAIKYVAKNWNCKKQTDRNKSQFSWITPSQAPPLFRF